MGTSRSHQFDMWTSCGRLIAVIVLLPTLVTAGSDIPHDDVSNWASRFGARLWEIGKQATRIREIRERFQAEARIERIDGLAMVKDFGEEVENMLADKMEAIKRIMDAAEQLAMSHVSERGRIVDYLNMKKMNSYVQIGLHAGSLRDGFKEVALTRSRHFGQSEVNTSTGAVHVPSNVFDGATDVMNAIYWSEHLDRIFLNNYESDPSLSWQYFASATGFMRQFPATKWGHDDSETDLFDSRLRPWYLQAAASAKDVFILVDTSGSMTGVRKDIARQVVLTLIDTLTENDFVNIYRFGDQAKPTVPCFRDKMVQANLENIRVLKNSMEGITLTGIANFTSALSSAFEVLAKYNRSMQGAQCNQVIMLVTDGAPRDYKEVYQKYNWPHKLVRIFSYLIGREIIDTTATKTISCANKGFFVRVTTLAEVREQVLRYIPVLSRPMVMYQRDHPLTWTPVYADLADPKLGDWLWELRERRRQQRRSTNYRQLARLTWTQRNASLPLQDDPTIPFNTSTMMMMNASESLVILERFLNEGKWLVTDRQVTENRMREKRKERLDKNRQKYNLVTSVATPVFDLKNYSVRTANLLGVAGTDVPIAEIVKRTPAYRMGPNGYSFLINNNGYLLHHPDFRPLIYDILKPNYNTVDLSEVELVDSDDGPRDSSSPFLAMRREMVEQREGENAFRVRVHYDNMKRASVRRQRYYYRGLKNTPFSLGVALPDEYGHFRVVAETEIKREVNTNGVNVTSFFAGENWRVHPDWVYCRYNYQGANRSFETVEAEILHFMDGAQRAGWKWNSKHPRPHAKGTRSHSRAESSFFCDKHLMQSLVFDAQATEIFDKKFLWSIDRQEPHVILQSFGISIVFVATRSGLLRWRDITPVDEQLADDFGPFHEINAKANDQVWYKRAVDQYEEDPDSFVYSIPFDAGILNDSLVTASHAIFVDKDGYRAPAAVVGLQFRSSALKESFFNLTFECTRGPCEKTCSSDDLDCYVLDNNGFVLISEENHQTGRFLGDIDGAIMESLIESQIYQRIRIFDYQAVCADPLLQKSAEKGEADFKNMTSCIQVGDNGTLDICYKRGLHMELAYINKTRTRPCDKYVDLYSLQTSHQVFDSGKARSGNARSSQPIRQGDRNYSIQKIPHSNLVLLVVDTSDDYKGDTAGLKISVDPLEIVYNETERCDRMHDHLFRLRPAVCVSYHPEEEDIKLCGGAGSIQLALIVLASSLWLDLIATRLFTASQHVEC